MGATTVGHVESRLRCSWPEEVTPLIKTAAATVPAAAWLTQRSLTSSVQLEIRPLGVARYVRDHERRDSAEIAMSLLETWQGRGVGKALLRRLAHRARAENVSRFTALMLADNRPIRRVLEDLGEPVILATGPGTVELAVDLQQRE
jgi:RimJ/RimL family protein N-acetyltransferase